jgi:hypothetical protein
MTRRRAPRPGRLLGAALLLLLATAHLPTPARAGEHLALPERPLVDQRSSPLGPLVTDFRAYEPPSSEKKCLRCGGTHAAYAACVGLYKAANGWVELPYHDQNWIYGYYDYAWARGPVITLGTRALVPGFRGYGLWGSPGYGVGQRPVSAVDREVLGGHWYPENRRLWPRWSHWPK